MLDFQHVCKNMKKISEVRKTIYFRKLDDQDFNAIMHCLQGRIIDYKEGDYIVQTGDKISFAYLIISGIARSIQIDENGNEFINLDYQKENMFGLNDIINQNKYFSEDLKALTDVTVLALDSFRLINPTLNRCQRHIDLLKGCFKEIGRQNNAIMMHKHILSLSKTREKVMEFLYMYEKKKKNSEFDIDYTRAELANLLGVERSALSYELSKLKKDGIIDFSLNHFKIIKNRNL